MRGGSPWPRIAAVCAVIVLASLLTALFVASRQPTQYAGRADLLYVAATEVPLDVRERVLATHARLMTTRAVLEPVAASSGMELAELQDALSVEIGLDDVLEVTVTTEDPVTARALAQAVADAYVSFAATVPSQDNIRLLSRAYSVDEPVGPSMSRAVAVGLLVGLQLALLAGLLMLWASRRRRTP